ncbi:MAG: Crp/Fnr family transcriptional regulator [Saprospiraceae bacterium]
MENKLVNYFSKITPLSLAEKSALAESAVPKFFPKGTFLLKEGQLSVDTYFIFAGCVREYILLDGEEKTSGLFTEDQWIISLNNFSSDSPKNRNLICVEDCELIVGN